MIIGKSSIYCIFDFFPNIDAANYVLNAAKSNNDYCYILAGRKSTTLNLPDLDNLFFFDNLSNSEMSYLLSACDVFYSPIVLGSGMKTKLQKHYHMDYIFMRQSIP